MVGPDFNSVQSKPHLKLQQNMLRPTHKPTYNNQAATTTAQNKLIFSPTIT
jgi:hypothetical protein